MNSSSRNSRQTIQRIAAVMLSSVILCFTAFYNRFPLVFNNDTGMYLENAFNWYVPADRPALYGLFVFFTSQGISLWMTIFAQALLIALLLYYYFRYFSCSPAFLKEFLVFSLVAALCTACSFTVSLLIPDIFTAIAIMSMGLLLFVPRLKIRDTIILCIMNFWSVGVHNSNFLTCICMVVLVLTGVAISRWKKRDGSGPGPLRTSGLALLVLAGYLNMGLMHYLIDGKFCTTRGGSVFWLSNLIEMGLVDKYLHDNCAGKNYVLCADKDSLPNNFLWSEKSPIRKTGGWEANRAEYTAIIKDMVIKPAYLIPLMYKSTVYTIKQFFNYDMTDIARPSERIVRAVDDNFSSELPMLLAGRENHDRLDLGLMNFLQQVLLTGSLVGFGWWLTAGTVPRQYRQLMLFVLGAMLVNAWICSTFSGVFPRYQGRVAWLILLPVFLYTSPYTLLAGAGNKALRWLKIKLIR
jgi:hypothetical protein